MLLSVAVVLLVADQLTKAAVAAGLTLGAHLDVVGDLVQIWHAENSGAAFSLFQNGLPLFLVVSVVALGMVVYFARSLAGRSLWYFVVLGMVLGGTLGNLVDRVTRGGRVIDFVSVGFGDTRFPTFNVADSSLTVGILLLVVLLWLVDRDDVRAADPASAPNGTTVRPAGGGPADRPGGGGTG